MLNDMAVLPYRTHKGLWLGLSFFICLGLMLSIGAAGHAAASPEEQAVKPAEKPSMADKWGIEVVALRTSAAGNMLDFRYKVLDSEKAQTLFSRETKPYLIHASSGKVLSVPVTPKIGPLRSANKPQEGRTYWMFFGNKTKLVQKGDKVTVVIGKFKAENLTIE